MSSTKTRAIYERLLVLGLLTICLVVFGFSDKVGSVQAAAAPCVQECETTQFSCNDQCHDSCLADQTTENCNSCILTCRSAFHNCLNHAVWCDNEVSQPGRCEVNYGRHCILMPGGTYSCSESDGAYDAYYLTCENLGGGSCVACPGQHYCSGTSGTPGCIPS